MKINSLDLSFRAKGLSPTSVFHFYYNLEQLYLEHKYEPLQIWNCDESGAQANKNGEATVFARKGRSIHTIVPNERQWIFVLVAVNSTSQTMPYYYVFKGKREREEFISYCEDGVCMGM